MNFYIDKYQSEWHIDVDRYTNERAAGHGKGTTTMIRMDTPWLIGRRDAQEERYQLHVAAIREARAATKDGQGLAGAARAAAPARRLALASAGTGSTVDLCASSA